MTETTKKGRFPEHAPSGKRDDLDFMNLRDVIEYTRLSSATVDRMQERDPGFPKPGYVGRRRLWVGEEIREWLHHQIKTNTRKNSNVGKTSS